jgi:hypothetical protein
VVVLWHVLVHAAIVVVECSLGQCRHMQQQGQSAPRMQQLIRRRVALPWTPCLELTRPMTSSVTRSAAWSTSMDAAGPSACILSTRQLMRSSTSGYFLRMFCSVRVVQDDSAGQQC